MCHKQIGQEKEEKEDGDKIILLTKIIIKKKYKKNPYFMKFTKSRIIYFPVLSSGTENTSKLDSQHLIKSTLK